MNLRQIPAQPNDVWHGILIESDTDSSDAQSSSTDTGKYACCDKYSWIDGAEATRKALAQSDPTISSEGSCSEDSMASGESDIESHYRNRKRAIERTADVPVKRIAMTCRPLSGVIATLTPHASVAKITATPGSVSIERHRSLVRFMAIPEPTIVVRFYYKFSSCGIALARCSMGAGRRLRVASSVGSV